MVRRSSGVDGSGLDDGDRGASAEMRKRATCLYGRSKEEELASISEREGGEGRSTIQDYVCSRARDRDRMDGRTG